VNRRICESLSPALNVVQLYEYHSCMSFFMLRAPPRRVCETVRNAPGSKSDRAVCSCRGRITRKSAAPHAMAPLHQDKPRRATDLVELRSPIPWSALYPFKTHHYAGRSISCHPGLESPVHVGVCVRTCRSRLLGLAKVLSHRVQACVRLRACPAALLGLLHHGYAYGLSQRGGSLSVRSTLL
jgi:hypothetical protein